MSFGTSDLDSRWPRSRILYTLNEDDFPVGSRGRAGIERVLDYLAIEAGIPMVRRTSEDNYVQIERVADRSAAREGRVGGAQPLYCAIADLSIAVDEKVTYADTSRDQVGLTVEGIGPPNGTTLYLLAWRGEGDGYLNLARVGRGSVEAKVTVPVQIDAGPTIISRLTVESRGWPPGPPRVVIRPLIAAPVGDHVALFGVPRTEIDGPLGAPTRLTITGVTAADLETYSGVGVGMCEASGTTYLAWCRPDRRIVIATVRALTGTTAELRIIRVLTERTDRTPALASHHGVVYLGWRGLDDRINLMTVTGDRAFLDNQPSGFTTESAVSLASVEIEAGHPRQLLLAYRTMHNQIGLAWAQTTPGGAMPVNALGQEGFSLEERTFASPSLASGAGTRVGVPLGSIPDPGCIAWIGAGSLAINTAPLYLVDDGSLVHEVGHALGLIHEHQRPDRDSHVMYVGPQDAEYRINYRIRKDGIMLGGYDLTSTCTTPPHPIGWSTSLRRFPRSGPRPRSSTRGRRTRVVTWRG